MNYTTVTFLLFVTVSAVLYYVVPKKIRWTLLLVASYAFYLWGGFSSAAFILCTTLTTFSFALRMNALSKECSALIAENPDDLSFDELRALKQKYRFRRRRWLIALFVINFGILAVVKYLPAIINGTPLLSLIYPEDSGLKFELIVPLGVSFYTFTSMGYAIDIFREKYDAETNLGKFALFVSFFPQIIQGPIARFDHLGSQLFEGHELKFDNLSYGAELILWGYFKKLIIADRITVFVAEVYGHYDRYDGVMTLLGVLAYCLQIYADFSGGIDISRGVARLYGIELASNFKRPYFSNSITEYWRRWHISLGDWMRDYVFYSVMFSRPYKAFTKFCKQKLGKTYGRIIPSFLTTYPVFILIGVWHGASWSFVVFGLYNATVICLGMLLQPTFDKITAGLKIDKESANWKCFEVVRTFCLVVISRFFSRASTLSAAVHMLASVFDLSKTWDYFIGRAAISDAMPARSWYLVLAGTMLLLIVSIIQERGTDVHEALKKLPIAVRWTILFALVIFVIWCGNYNSSQGIVDLIYGQF
ncbi:MAG: MBOAT family protein [Clostridia bacterium]|nr:MBOAT family protein [Clostridia bacterium]